MLPGLFLVAATALAAPPGWTLVDSDGDVKIYNREVEGTSLLAFRGEGSVAASIGKVIDVVMTPARFGEWTDLLTDVAPVEIEAPRRVVVWEHYDNPWPVSDRDFIYEGKADIRPAEHSVFIRYRSIERSDVPVQDCCVRGRIVDASFRFTPRPDGTTFIECEAMVDPGGWLPAWLVNMVQHDWARNTLEGLRRQVRKPYVKDFPGFDGWHAPAEAAAAAASPPLAEAPAAPPASPPLAGAPAAPPAEPSVTP